MSKNKKTQEVEDNFENLEEALSKTELYIEKNQKKLTLIALVIIVIVLGFFGYQKYYRAPLEENALNQMYQAQIYFAQDSFKMALNGDENYPGFLDIIDEFGSTKAGNLAEYYAGVSFLRTGDFAKAIEHLNNFSTDDFLLGSLAKAATGDAQMELGKTKEAAESYMAASKINPNDFSTPIYLQKAGLAYEMIGNYKDALTAYQTIEKEYVKSAEARDIEKYITRAKMHMKK